MTWLLGIGFGGATIATIVLAIKVVALGRDYASRLGEIHERADKAIGDAKAETSKALAAQRIAETARDAHRVELDRAIAGLETARAELGRERGLSAKRAQTIEGLQAIIDRADTPAAVRERLRGLLGVSRVTG